ncbi:M56 family metallopeptidase [Frankia sp. Cppng1_Ct_nod]|uniref:M56 family metallopeptidase n=1 Tax=Frankia sp. Cppng1_Ct_nod TaxID=2897162 RepID=UPI0010415411|nr:M56 family metallopeptidase [Frankia sp. Cppng1_Ct_nod]
MRLAIYLAGVAALVLLAVARPAARRLPPPRAALLLAAAALGTAAVWVVVVGLLTFLLVGQVPLVAALGRWSASLVGAGDPVPPAASVVAWVAVAVGVAGCGTLAWRLTVEARRWLPAYRHAACAGRLVVIDDPTPAAVAVPGWPGRIVVSSGMLKALPPDEQRVLLAHERCHLDHAHWLFRFAVRLAAATCPPTRPLVAACDQALERWADETAAAATGDRWLTAQAVARAALARHDSALTAAGFTDGQVSARIEALLAPPPRGRWAPAVVPLLLLAMATACALKAGHDVNELFEIAENAIRP